MHKSPVTLVVALLSLVGCIEEIPMARAQSPFIDQHGALDYVFKEAVPGEKTLIANFSGKQVDFDLEYLLGDCINPGDSSCWKSVSVSMTLSDNDEQRMMSLLSKIPPPDNAVAFRPVPGTGTLSLKSRSSEPLVVQFSLSDMKSRPAESEIRDQVWLLWEKVAPKMSSEGMDEDR